MNIIKKIFKNKLFLTVLVIGAVIGVYYTYKFFTKTPVVTRYVTTPVVLGTISSSISGTGSVSSTSQVDIKPQASGQIISLPIKIGQKVKAGSIIATLDSQTAQKSIRDAKASLDSAKLSLEKLMQPSSDLSLLQAQNSLIQAQTTKQNAEDSLTKSYDDGFTALSNAFLDLPSIMSGLQEVLMGNDANRNQGNIDFYADSAKVYDAAADTYRNDALASYQIARTAYNKNFASFKSISRASDKDEIMTVVDETYETTNAIAEAVKNSANLVQFYNDKLTEKNLKPLAVATTHLNSLNNFTTLANKHVSSLLNITQTVQNNQNTIISSDRTIAEKTASLAEIKSGPDALDIKSAEMTIKQRENSLLDAQQVLSDYYVRAPFAGTIAVVPVSLGDQASSGTTVATLLADQQVTDIALNETDVTKIKVGQKATLAFDAIENLIITGEVSSIDLIGTASQGVVSYNAKIVFDTQDERIKSGMSVSASIITNTEVDVLTVPNSAVKTQGNETYVQVLVDGQPVRKTVVTGLSNDTDTQIISGLTENEEVVTQTVTTGATKTTGTNSNTSTSALQGLTGGGSGRPTTGSFPR